MNYSWLSDFDYREKNVLPQNLIDSAKKGVLSTRIHDRTIEPVTLTEESLFLLYGRNPEIAKVLMAEGYTLTDKMPVLKIITDQPPNKIWYHPRTGKKLCDDVDFVK